MAAPLIICEYAWAENAMSAFRRLKLQPQDLHFLSGWELTVKVHPSVASEESSEDAEFADDGYKVILRGVMPTLSNALGVAEASLLGISNSVVVHRLEGSELRFRKALMAESATAKFT